MPRQPEYTLGRLNGRYVVSWWEHGRRRRYRLKATTKGEAQREAVDRIRLETRGPDGFTIEDLWSAYRQEKEGRRVVVAMKHEWKAMGPHFGHLRADQLTIDACRAYTKLRRKAKKGDGTIWTELGHLRTVLTWAHKRRMIDFAPAVERPPKPAPRDRYLTNAEIDRLLAAPMAHHIKLAVLLMLSTAARVGAILELRWERVDFERGQVDLRASDIGPRKGRAVVPMNDGLRAALAAAKNVAMSEYVIEWGGGPVKSIKTGFTAAVREAGLKNVSPHTCRHTAAVHLVASGKSMEKVAQFLGHTNTQVTRSTYGRFAPDHLREEAAILDFTKPREVQ